MHILLIEDNPDHAQLVQQALRKPADKVDVTHVETLDAGFKTLASEKKFDAILLDMSLPDGEGPDCVAAIESRNYGIPIVVLTSINDNKTAMDSLERGAEDYLVKDRVTTNTLMRSLCYAIQRYQVNTENRRLVQELEAATKLLARKNRRLRKLYKTAQRFVDNVSHEFRTPLTVIKEYGSLIRDGIVGPVNEEQDQMLSVIEDRADDLNTMVDDMLDISKLEAGVMGMWRKNCRVDEIVKHIEPSLRRKAIVKDVQLTIDVAEDLPEVYCDDEKIGRVLTNLVVNAIKFCGTPGKVTLSAKLDSGSSQIIVTVTDDGQGIGDENLEAIFARFKQMDNARGSCKGFGLGLSIAKELVDLNFGSMHVESEVGVGSAFSFTIPLAKPTEVIKRYLDRQQRRRREACIAFVKVTVDEEVEPRLLEEVGSFLNYVLRSTDLLFETGERTWLLLATVPGAEVGQLKLRIEKERQDANRNRPFGPLPELRIGEAGCWSLPQERSDILADAKGVLKCEGEEREQAAARTNC